MAHSLVYYSRIKLYKVLGYTEYLRTAEEGIQRVARVPLYPPKKNGTLTFNGNQ